jgi:Fe-S cluster assembly ATP-binding protein
MQSLEIKDLHISIGDKPIVNGLSLTVNRGEVHAVMGPNGTGKSTLAKAIAGHPDYTITSGDVLVDGASILEMEPDERARAGVFLAFQYPSEIPGVSIANIACAASLPSSATTVARASASNRPMIGSPRGPWRMPADVPSPLAP